MLLNALWDPEVAQQTSVYASRAGEVAGTFLWAVAIMSVVIFLGAVVASMRVPTEPPK